MVLLFPGSRLRGNDGVCLEVGELAGGPRRCYPSRPLIFKSSTGFVMSRICQVTGKGPTVGNTVSHANNKHRRRFLPNLQSHRYWVEAEQRFVKLRLSANGMRIIDKKGIEVVLADIRARGIKV